MQRNGNLVLYGGQRALWATHTYSPGSYVAMQTDGNLVVYAGAVAKWSSGTSGFSGAFLQLQDDSNLVVYKGSQAVWDWGAGYLGDRLFGGATLSPGAKLQSRDHQYQLIMQTDGNLVLYRGTAVLWATYTSTPGSYLAMQTDGNLVVYAGAVTKWSSGTSGFSGAFLQLQDDSNLVVYKGSQAVWDWGAGYLGDRLFGGATLSPGAKLQSRDHQYQLIMQTDGNLVLYRGTAVLWATYTSTPGSYLAMQTDGNLVVYGGAVAEWNSGTAGHAGAFLWLQDDSNLVIYQGSTAIWDWRSGLLTVSAPWTPDGSANGFFDENDYTDNPRGEWGVDVPLPVGTPIRAPQSGTIIAYQQWSYSDQCGIAWCPGRLLVSLSGGAVVAFGHVNPVSGIGAGVSVSAGQEIATVACNHPGCPAPSDPGDGDHVEFMYDASGSNYDSRSSFIPPSPVSPTNGCPHHSQFANGGTGADPCVVLADFMHGRAP